MERPGIMLYFDILEPIRVLPDEDKGSLLVAMLEYGRDGIVPEFDGLLAMAWGFIRPKLDKDGESYDNAKMQRKYAAFCKKRASLGLAKIPFEEWLDMDDDERIRLVSPGNEPQRIQRPVNPVESRYPTTTTTTPTATSTTTKTTASTAAAAAATTAENQAAATAAQSTVKIFGGKLGKGVVMLSEDQIDSLLDQIGLEQFDYYVDKLAAFILKNDAHVKNHYETILKWVKEDSRV